MMFAVSVVLNEKGTKKIFESIQCDIDNLNGLSEKLNQYGIKDEHVKSIEIIDSKHWNGWKYY